MATGYVQSNMTYNTLITLQGIIVNDQLTETSKMLFMHYDGAGEQHFTSSVI